MKFAFLYLDLLLTHSFVATGIKYVAKDMDHGVLQHMERTEGISRISVILLFAKLISQITDV
jgi:hypothetical protein